MDAKCLVLLGAAVLSFSAGCSTPAVGDPCLPEQPPETGFSDLEAYVESSSVQCETRVCIVFKLAGDPRLGCRCCPEDEANGCVTPPACVQQQPTVNEDGTMTEEPTCPTCCELRRRVYCTCRCDAADTGFGECECPDGYSCVDVLEQGGPGVRGGYCVKDGTFTQ